MLLLIKIDQHYSRFLFHLVVFLKNNTILRNNDTIIEIGNYNFKTEKGLVKARYNFVFAKIEGSLKIISHFSEPI